MARFGILCLPGRGHLYPAAALGRELARRGHQYLFFNEDIVRGFARTFGIPFQAFPGATEQYVMSTRSESYTDTGQNTVNVIEKHASLILRSGVRLFQDFQLDALIVDQADLASGSVAEALGIPFFSLSFFPPVYLYDTNPPFSHTWSGGGSLFTRNRIRIANQNFSRVFTPTLEMVNGFRMRWGLRRIIRLNDAFSKHAIITQLPRFLELPCVQMPNHVYYTGMFDDLRLRRASPFPWHRLNGFPLIFLTFGTVRNEQVWPFVMIAEALADLRVQLVISLGGTYLTPDDLPHLPGDPIVVHYAPQRELLSGASLTIFHGGMNTCLESVASGIPMLAIPIADDQPGVASRLRIHGLGEVLSYRKLTTRGIRSSVLKILMDDRFSANAKAMQRQMVNLSGVEMAADKIESFLK